MLENWCLEDKGGGGCTDSKFNYFTHLKQSGLKGKVVQIKQPKAYLPTVPISSGQSQFGDQNPMSHPTTQKSRFVPILSRSTPQNTILTLPFACSLCSSVGFQVSSVSFVLFFSRTPPWWAVIQTKNLYSGFSAGIFASRRKSRRSLPMSGGPPPENFRLLPPKNAFFRHFWTVSD